jgi:hypothetical protein
MDDRTLRYLDEARQRIISAMASARVRSDRDEEAVQAAQRAFARVLPRLPAMIRERVPEAAAQIYTPAAMGKLLAEFAADMLAIQTNDLLHEVEPKQADR